MTLINASNALLASHAVLQEITILAIDTFLTKFQIVGFLAINTFKAKFALITIR
jgi:hypothetical protein